MNNPIQKIYEFHHSVEREDGFSIMKKQRGQLLQKFIGTGKIVLDVGCRDGALTQFFSEGNNVLGVDIDKKSLIKAKEKLGIETIHMDLNDDWSVLENRKFDIIFAGEVLEHVYYPRDMIKKIKEHLNDGGIFIGSVPNAFSLKNRIRYLFGQKRNTPLDDPTHITQFSMSELRQILSSEFKNLDIIGIGRYKKLSKIFPNLISFILFFIAKNE